MESKESSVVAGKRAVTEAVEHAPETVETVLVEKDKSKALANIVGICRKAGVKIQTVPRAKLDAAAQLNLPILMVERPAPPPDAIAATVPEAVAWVRATVATGR